MAGFLWRKANRIAHNAFQQLYEIHRPHIFGRGGMGTDAFAESQGDFSVANKAVTKARRTAFRGCLLLILPESVIENAAYKAALKVFKKAQTKNQLSGTRSATVVRAYLLSGNFLQ